MGSPTTESTAERPSWVRLLGVVTLVVIFGTSVLAVVSTVAGGLLAAGLGTILFVVFTLALLRHRSSGPATIPTESDDESADDSSVWNAIPSWQYDGRHAESGGLTRGEQERALQEIQNEAESLADDPDHRPNE